jgi:hypothetical protein
MGFNSVFKGLRLKIKSHYMRHVQVKLVQGCSWVKVPQNLEKNHQRHFYRSATDTHVNVPSAKNFLRCCLKPQTKTSCTISSNMNVQPWRDLFNGKKMKKIMQANVQVICTPTTWNTVCPTVNYMGLDNIWQ